MVTIVTWAKNDFYVMVQAIDFKTYVVIAAIHFFCAKTK